MADSVSPPGAASEQKVYATPSNDHVSLGGPIRGGLFWPVPLVLFALALWGVEPETWEQRIPQLAGAGVLSVLWRQVVAGVRVGAEWEKAVILRLGTLQGIQAGGIFYVLPGIDYVRFIDTRTLVLNIPQQKAITRDNVPAVIDSALFFTVADPGLAITAVQDFRFAIAQYTQAALRDVVGASTLDELLSEREQVQRRIASTIGERVQSWGLRVDSVQLQDFELPEDLKRVMSRQAAAEREKRATITKSEGDRLAAENLAAAADIMATNPIALELRALQTLDGLGSSPSNTVVLFPMELAHTLQTLIPQGTLAPPDQGS